MRYTWPGRHIELEWEGTQRLFRVSSAVGVSAKRKQSPQDTLDKKMNGLSLSGTTNNSTIWVVGWDCDIQLADDTHKPKGQDVVSLLAIIYPIHPLMGLS
jgi:hypothetical protein